MGLALGACFGQGSDRDAPSLKTQANSIDDSGGALYRIVSVASGKALDVSGKSMDDGAAIQQWGYWGGDNQQWRFRRRGGALEIVSASSGKCLDVAGISKDDGARIQQWSCSGGANQAWDVRPDGGGAVAIVSVNSGKCLDVPAGSPNDGTTLQQYGCWGGDNQRFRIEPVDGGGGGGAGGSNGSGGGGGPGPKPGAGSLREAAERSGRLMGVALSTQHFSDAQYLDLAAREFDYVTPENELKWDATEPDRGRFTFDGGDAIVGFAEQHGMRVKGHNLVWHAQLPGWVQQLSDPNDIRAAMDDHIRALVGRYKGRVLAWDVVNEVIDDGNGNALRSSVFSRLGDTFIDEAFRVAHEVDPSALLFYNDYGIEGLGGKSDAAYNLARRLVNSGVPISGVGLQMHIGSEGWPSASDIEANIRRLTDLGLLVNISEIDVNTCDTGGDLANKMAVQEKRYREVVAACAKNERCHAVTAWGVVDKYSWLNSFAPCTNGQGSPWALPFDDSYNRKPAWQGIVDALTSP